MKETFFAAMVLVLALGLAAGDREDTARFPLDPVAVVDGFAVPECALVEPETDFVYVSNIEAAPDEYWSDNGKGFISRLHPDGTVETLRWIDSQPDFVINSPKGMCILDGRLYVADNTRVLVFALNDGRPLQRIPVSGSERLNDMTTDGQDVYVSDSAVGRILRLDVSGEGEHDLVAELEGSNGITFDGEQMFAVSWDLHEVYEIDRRGEQPPQPFGLADHFTNLDGIEVLNDGLFLVSDFVGGKVCLISADRETVTMLAELESPAEFGIDHLKRRLYVPQLRRDSLAIFDLT